MLAAATLLAKQAETKMNYLFKLCFEDFCFENKKCRQHQLITQKQQGVL